MGKITDKGCLIYMFAVRESIKHRRNWRMIWVPTESCLADDLTKSMQEGSGLWPLIYQHGWWSPFQRSDLEEDYITMEPPGSVQRWRLMIV